jgi:hypothetical protein
MPEKMVKRAESKRERDEMRKRLMGQQRLWGANGRAYNGEKVKWDRERRTSWLWANIGLQTAISNSLPMPFEYDIVKCPGLELDCLRV